MGLERLRMVLQGRSSVFKCDLFEPWMSTLPGIWQPDERSLRILADHLRASIVIVADGVRPSNTGRGYVLRRLLRRGLTILWRDDGTRSLCDLPDPLIAYTLTPFGQDDGPVHDVIHDDEHPFARLLTLCLKVPVQLQARRAP